MPANKHKRKASAHTQANTAKRTQSSGLVAAHPKIFVILGVVFIILGLLLMTFKSQDNAMFGLAMLALISGVVTTIYANFAVPKKKSK
tara:strand:+ start:105 stop:368 length:264 start_codon:yes stop_codon:yes gene_type:complete